MAVRAVETRYSVPGWGVGELWTRGDLVLAHEFVFDADAGGIPQALRAGSPKGADAPPTGNVRPNSSHMGDDFVPNQRLRTGEPTRTGAGFTEHPGDRSRLDPDVLARRLSLFLAGDDVGLDDVPLDLESSTPFQHAITTTLRRIPRGEIVSYGELAALSGYPGAGRAVGTFCARNRFMFLVPCHRVVGAVGIGGYGSAGVGIKRRLLALEGVAL